MRNCLETRARYDPPHSTTIHCQDLIRDCQAFDPEARPTMAQISTRIAKLINELRDVQPVRMPAARQAARKAA